HGRDRRRVSPRLYLCRRHAAPRRRARPWGGYRRATCVALSLPSRLFAREPAGARRHVVALVNAMACRLTDAALAGLPHDIARPAFDRARLRPGIVHLGIGAFHRAHQAMINDLALAATGDARW